MFLYNLPVYRPVRYQCILLGFYSSVITYWSLPNDIRFYYLVWFSNPIHCNFSFFIVIHDQFFWRNYSWDIKKIICFWVDFHCEFFIDFQFIIIDGGHPDLYVLWPFGDDHSMCSYPFPVFSRICTVFVVVMKIIKINVMSLFNIPDDLYI